MSHAHPTSAPPQRPLWQTFAVFLGPLMLSNVLQSLSGTINTIFLGQMIGAKALAAGTVSFPLVFFLIALVIGLGAGSSVLIGQAWGAQSLEKVKTVAGSALFVALVAGVVIAILGGSFAHHLMVLMQTPADILEDAARYVRVILIGMPAFFIFILWTSMLRGVGDTMTPLWALAVSTVVGLAVTPALIQGWGGLPRLGPASAAVAGIASQVAGLVFMAWSLARRKSPLALDAALFTHIRPNGAVLRGVLKIGVPTGVQMVTVAVSELVLLGLANKYGALATAAYGAVNQVLAYVQFPAMSIAITASILGAQAIGAGRAERLPAIMRAGQLINLILTGTGVAVVYLLSSPIIAAFSPDPEFRSLTQHLLHIVVWSILFFGASGVFGGVMRASGTVMAPMILTLTAILLIEIPTATFLSGAIGIDGVWWGYPAAFISMFVMQGAYYALVWRKKRVERLI